MWLFEIQRVGYVKLRIAHCQFYCQSDQYTCTLISLLNQAGGPEFGMWV